MTSFFGWLDHSEQDQRRARDAIDLFREQDTRDELGIGSIRDAFADMLFPGTSTIQTRARYFLLVPWVYLKLESQKIPSKLVATAARTEEIALVKQLAKSNDTEGVIGIEARDRLQRLPSAIYWQGLRAWRIRLFPGTQGQYHRSLDAYYASLRRSHADDDGEPLYDRVSRNWHGGLPSAPTRFPHTASLTLHRIEAEYLRDRIMAACGGTMLAFLVDRGAPHEPVAFPWQHPQVAELPPHLRELLGHARNFSDTIHGSALLYNLMLAEKATWTHLATSYQQQLQVWQQHIDDRRATLMDWSLEAFWHTLTLGGARISLLTRQFVHNWLALVLSSTAIAQNQLARTLIYQREQMVKGGQARLDNRRALELWGGASGTGQLTYRWPNAQRHLQDIYAGLTEATSIAQPA